MASRARKQKRGVSYKTGEKGNNRVRLFSHPRDGTLYLEYHVGRLKKRIGLGHTDEQLGKQAADTLALKLRENQPPPQRVPTLRTLFDIYLREVSPQKSTGKQKHDKRCALLFTRCFGADRLPLTLAKRDFDRFVTTRRDGTLAVGKRTTGVRDCMIGYDLRMLNALFNWAVVAGDGSGGVLLPRNPFKGFALPKEDNPRRPVATEDMYQAMRAVARQVNPMCLELLVLAHETGHRGQSIRMLKFRDIDFSARRVVWRSEHDKTGFQHVTTLTPDAVQILEGVRKERPAIGDAWLFPSPLDPTKPLCRRTLSKWWKAVERLAKIDPVAGRGWHSFRRNFANEMKHTPLVDLARLGGWKCTNTILTVYQQPDEETMRKAQAGRIPLKDVANGHQ